MRAGDVNRYRGTCSRCMGVVPAQGGVLTRIGATWGVLHLDCAKGGPGVWTVTDADGRVLMQRNRRGTCEDAPCCGCCF